MLEEYIDSEIIQSPAYWMLTGGALLALMIGFKMQGLWTNGDMPLFSKIVTLLLVPVASYFITMKMRS